MWLATLALLVAVALHVTPGPALGQTFVFGAQGEPVQLDPAIITDGISSRITRQVFDGLVRYKGPTTEVEPALAERWDVSRDSRVWTFQLRRGVKFHDGSPLDAAAVVWNFKDNSQRLGALKAGEIHGMEGLNPEDVLVVKSDPSLQLLLRPTNTTGYIAFNYKVKEFQDKRVREAFAHAVNKKAIVDALYGGTGLVATQFQPPSLWGYNRELRDFEYSPAKAQALLRGAGFAQGVSEITWDDGKREPLVFWYMSRSRPYFPNPKEIAEAMAADIAKVGIKAQLQTAEWAVYLDKRKNGQLPLYMLGWTGDNGDPTY